MTACLMLDVDGVLVTGRPQDGRHWSAGLKQDLGIDPAALQRGFFAPHWAGIVTGRADLAEVLEACLSRIAPEVPAQRLIDYWFEMDARIDSALLAECDTLRRHGTHIWLCTNQEHLRAAWLMERLRGHVDGMVHSAGLGAAKPDAAFFHAAAAHVGLPPAALVLVDDSPKNVEAAMAAGWGGRVWDPVLGLARLLGQGTGQSPA